jgi:hypothetical protein
MRREPGVVRAAMRRNRLQTFSFKSGGPSDSNYLSELFSKTRQFPATGRPGALSKPNVGLWLQRDVRARGAEEVIPSVEALLNDPGLAAKIGKKRTQRCHRASQLG